MSRTIVRRCPVIDAISEDTLDRIVEEAVERFKPLEDRDGDFERTFGKWRRPDNSPKYPIELWVARKVGWHRCGDGIFNAEHFVKAFPDKADRVLVGEICRFVAEEYQGLFATDETLKKFKANLLRRLDSVGY